MLFSTRMFSLLFVFLGFHGALAILEADSLIIARCRAKCIKSYMSTASPARDDMCIGSVENAQCFMCWGMCETLQMLFEEWGPICEDRKVCGEGCETACKFMTEYSSNVQEPVPSDQLWQFKTPPVVNIVDEANLAIGWDRPKSQDGGTEDILVVYSLLWRDETDSRWTLYAMGLEPKTTIEGAHGTFLGLEFKLQVVTIKGVMSEVFIPYPTAEEAKVSAVDVSNPVVTSSTPHHRVPSSTLLPPPAPSAFRLEVTMERLGGSLEAFINWRQPALGTRMCVLAWMRVSCHVDPGYPGCKSYTQPRTTVLSVEAGQSMDFALPQVTYNSKYEVEFSCGDQLYHRTDFTTDPCQHPTDNTLSECTSSPIKPQGNEFGWEKLLIVSLTSLLVVVVLVGIAYLVCKKCCCCHLVSKTKLREVNAKANYLDSISMASMPLCSTRPDSMSLEHLYRLRPLSIPGMGQLNMSTASQIPPTPSPTELNRSMIYTSSPKKSPCSRKKSRSLSSLQHHSVYDENFLHLHGKSRSNVRRGSAPRLNSSFQEPCMSNLNASFHEPSQLNASFHEPSDSRLNASFRQPLDSQLNASFHGYHGYC